MATPTDLSDDESPDSPEQGAFETRVQRLRQLQAQRAWDDSELARQLQRTPQQVYAWFKGQRSIGEKLARKIESALDLPPKWLDIADVVAAEPPPRSWGTSTSTIRIDTTRGRETPVIKWAQITAMLHTNNSAVEAAFPRLETFAPASSKAKFLTMPDDSMEPLISAGDHLLVDPAIAPRAGDVVLVSIPGGEHFLRTFQARTAQVFDAVASNSFYQPLSSNEDGAEVIAVMVEHRRYRRA